MTFGPRLKVSNTTSLNSSGMPGPSSSTTSRTSRPAGQADVDRALRRRVLVRVDDEVLDDALELRPIDLGDDRLAVESSSRPSRSTSATTRSVSSKRSTSSRRRMNEAAAQPLDVEQVGQQPVKPAGGLGKSRDGLVHRLGLMVLRASRA